MTGPTSISDVTCLACGCLCDDLDVTLESGRLLRVDHACGLGLRWLEASTAPVDCLPATLAGTPSSLDTALDRAASLLAASRSPLLTGLGNISIEAQRQAIALADRLGATVDAGSPESCARHAAMARAGRCSAMLGEVRARADLLCFWACDPSSSHPRHQERYSVDPPGRFVPTGRAGRHVLVVDSVSNATAIRADATLALQPEHRIAALAVLRALIRGAPVDPDRLVATTGHPLGVWTALAARLGSARYGALFTGASLIDPAEYETLLLLIRDLNQRPDGRFVHLTLGSPGNGAGAEAVLGWQGGYAPALSFATGYPERVDDVRPVDQFDLVLQLGDPMIDPAPNPHGIPTIHIAPHATIASPPASVAIATATLGVQTGGTILRCDGVTLPVATLFQTPLPSVPGVLQGLLARLEAHEGQGSSGP